MFLTLCLTCAELRDCADSKVIRKFTRGPSFFHATMRNKQVEFNP